MAERTGVSLDWLLRGVGDESPVYVGQERPRHDLEHDLAIHVRREIHRLESEARSTPAGIISPGWDWKPGTWMERDY